MSVTQARIQSSGQGSRSQDPQAWNQDSGRGEREPKKGTKISSGPQSTELQVPYLFVAQRILVRGHSQTRISHDFEQYATPSLNRP